MESLLGNFTKKRKAGGNPKLIIIWELRRETLFFLIRFNSEPQLFSFNTVIIRREEKLGRRSRLNIQNENVHTRYITL